MMAEKFNVDIYGFQQIADGILERLAVVRAVRYFNGPAKKCGMADYDVICNPVKVTRLQANWMPSTDCDTLRETQYLAYRRNS